jgi:predicted enzyme related to lactoylglutathione lyase
VTQDGRETVINAAHLLLFSQNADADRAFLRDVIGWPFVSAGGEGDPWLIFRLPPAEVAVHPTDGPPSTQLYLMCSDLTATLAELAELGVAPTHEPQHRGWGIVTGIRLPSGAELGLYQPEHVTAVQI